MSKVFYVPSDAVKKFQNVIKRIAVRSENTSSSRHHGGMNKTPHGIFPTSQSNIVPRCLREGALNFTEKREHLVVVFFQSRQTRVFVVGAKESIISGVGDQNKDSRCFAGQVGRHRAL